MFSLGLSKLRVTASCRVCVRCTHGKGRSNGSTFEIIHFLWGNGTLQTTSRLHVLGRLCRMMPCRRTGRTGLLTQRVKVGDVALIRASGEMPVLIALAKPRAAL